MILKAGTILIKDHQIGLIYRSYYDDYSFPKGHLEEGESLLECAIRETNEETKREVIILDEKPIYIENYVDSIGHNCTCYYYVAKDNGISNNESFEVHDLRWTDFDKVSELLTYDSTKHLWDSIKNKVKSYIEE